MDPRGWIVAGALLGAIGVSIGAFHAHGLEEWLAKQELSSDEVSHRMDNTGTAVDYQMIHAVALVLVGLIALRRRTCWITAAGYVLLAGVVLFCGLLYLWTFAGLRLHASLIPIGGTCLIVGWVLMAVAGLRISSE